MSDIFSEIFAENYDMSANPEYGVYINKVTGKQTYYSGQLPLKDGLPAGMDENSDEAMEYKIEQMNVYGLPTSVLDDETNKNIRDNQEQGSEINDPTWIQASKILHQFFHSGKTKTDGTSLIFNNDETNTLNSNEEYADWGQSFAIGMNHNMPKLVMNSTEMMNAPVEVAKAMYYIMETADRSGMQFGNFLKGVGNQFADVTNYIGLSTFGIGLASKSAGKALTKMAFKDALKKIVLSAPTKADVALGVEASVFMAADNLAKQNIEVASTKKEEIDKGSVAEDAAIGFATGVGLNKALTLGVTQAAKGFKIVKTKLGEIIAPPPPKVNPVIDDLRIISADELVGKKIFPIQADLTRAGGEYTGIDSSQLDIPIILQGGPDFPILQSSKDGKVVWAVDSKAVTGKKLNTDADYALVVSMAPDSHKTNATVTSAMIETSLAYLRDGRITDDIVGAVDAEIKLKFPEFPGLKSENVAEFTRDLSFEQRKILMDALSSKTAQQGGFPNLQAVLDATVDPAYSGLNSNDSIMILKINKDGGAVKLGEEGTQKHMSYEFGLKGEPVGRIPMVNARKMFPDWFKQRDADVAEMEKTGLSMSGTPLTRPPNTARAFQQNKITEEITQEKADAIKSVIMNKVKSPLQAKLVVAAMEGQWSTTSDLKKAGGITALNWIREARSSPEGITLSIPKGSNNERLNDTDAAAILQEEIKRGELVIYQLGNVAKDAKGKNDSRTLFGIRPNYNYNKEYDGIISNSAYKGPGFDDNDKALVSVLSNDKSANGIGKATVLKAIEEGVTVLDCYAVKTDEYDLGFLPEFYSQFGFETAGTVPFNKEFAPTGKEWDDLVKVWRDRGWKGDVDNGPYPDIVIMKYTGGEDARTNATRRFVQEGAFRTREGNSNGVFQGAIGNDGQLDGSEIGKSGQRSDTNNRASNQGDVQDGDGSSSTDRLAEVGRELLNATKEQIENLGIDYSRIQALRTQMGVK